MYMRKIISLSVLAISLSVPGLLPGQVTITGPTCVTTGTVYQYNIQGPWDSTSTMQVCITGGTIADSSITGHCTAENGAPLAAVRVSWNDLSGGSLSLTSSKGSASLEVNLVSGLQPGAIDSAVLVQEIDSGSIPQAIACSPARGGACSPGYDYQWQQSSDAVSWSDIPGATAENLEFSTGASQGGFYRRKLTERASGTIGYSDAASVNIKIKVN
jgi:hypothetical protein